MEILIPKGSKYPISNEKYYHNSQNYQKDLAELSETLWNISKIRKILILKKINLFKKI